MVHKIFLAYFVLSSMGYQTLAEIIDWSDFVGYSTSPTPEKRSKESNVASCECEDLQAKLSLNLRNTGLQRIDSDFISNANVSCLGLEDNEIAYVSPIAFRSMPNLIYLNLARNKLSLANFSQLDSHSQLRTLILDDNASPTTETPFILDFPNKFPRLIHLYLRGNGLTDIRSLSFAPNLMYLYLSSNNFGESRFSFLDDISSSLVNLDLAYNGIRRFDASKLSAVQKLRLDGNQINRLCGKTCRDSALVLEGVIALEKLELTRNAITSIESDAFDDTSDLLDLDLSYNQIDVIRKNTFESLGVLKNLSLQNNLLREMPDLCGPESLQYLTLANNQLELVGKDSFCMIEKLRFIDLSGNRIKTVEAGAFAKLADLENLKLSNNRLVSFPSTWLMPLAKLRVLHVDGNRLVRLKDLALDGTRYNPMMSRIYMQNNLINKFLVAALYNATRKLPNVTFELLDNSEESDKCECDCDEINEILD